MKISIKKLDGTTEELDVEGNQTVESVKSDLSEKTGIKSEQISLIAKGKPLVNTSTLEESGIKAGDKLFMVIMLRGGGF